MNIGLRLKKGESIQDLSNRYEICKKLYDINKESFDPEEREREEIRLGLFRAWIRQNGIDVN